MKVKNFLQDVSGASRVTRARLKAFEQASPALDGTDPIGEAARTWHPGPAELIITQIRDTGKTAKTIRFARPDGGKLPPFYAGQYMVLTFCIGSSIVSRPYSISSAPWQARQDQDPFVEITVRRSRGDGFVCDYIHDNLKPGDTVVCDLAYGQFYYEPLRDARHVLALAGGVGITPFASMAKEIAAGKMDCDLTILYGSVSSDDILLKEELEALEGDHVKVVHVLSGEDPSWQGERGFLTAELIRRYSREDTSCFICGPQAMYRFLREELKSLSIPRRRIRFEVFGQARDIASFEGYPSELSGKTFRLSVWRGIHEDVIPARADESIATALERAGIRIRTGCRSGECGLCRTKVLAGSFYVCPEGDGRRAADKDFNYVHACSAYPTGDLKIKIPIL